MGIFKDHWPHAGLHCCKHCLYFVQKVAATGPQPAAGRCRRHAPTHLGFPIVFPQDGCGDWRLDDRSLTS